MSNYDYIIVALEFYKYSLEVCAKLDKLKIKSFFKQTKPNE